MIPFLLNWDFNENNAYMESDMLSGFIDWCLLVSGRKKALPSGKT